MGNPQPRNPSIQRIDDRTVSFTAVFDTTKTSANAIKEVVMHGNSTDMAAYRASFGFITKDNNEIRVDILVEGDNAKYRHFRRA